MENIANKTFTFSYTYDNLDRLKTAMLNGATLFDINYYPNGNIQDKTDVGMYLYETEKPHAMSGIANVQSGVNQDVKQFIDYTPFHKISRIRQGADEFNITDQYNIYYGLDRQRIKTEQLHEGNILRTRYYIGTYEEENAGNAITKIDYIFTPTGLTAIQKGLMLYYVHTDRQGSIERITDIRGSIQTAYAYTAWGGRILLSGDSTITDRGYTGHEHLTAFQTADGFTLINMNGRVYDPVLARFLSPDPYVQAPDFTQSFNRYSYCLNNPFKYTDESGEFWNFIIGAVIGGISNWISNGAELSWRGLGYFGAGAVVGAASAGLGAWAAGATNAVGILAGAGIGAATGAVSGAITGVALNGLNNVIQGQNFWTNGGKSALSGFIGGAISGAITGGIKGFQAARKEGLNPWTGRNVEWDALECDLSYRDFQPQSSKNACVDNAIDNIEISRGGDRGCGQQIRDMIAPGSNPEIDGLKDIEALKKYATETGGKFHGVTLTEEYKKLGVQYHLHINEKMYLGNKIVVTIPNSDGTYHSFNIQGAVNKVTTTVKGISTKLYYIAINNGNRVLIPASSFKVNTNFFWIRY